MKASGMCDRAGFLFSVALTLFASASAHAQQGQPPQSATPVATPRAADGHPDLNGYWTAALPGAGFPRGDAPPSADGKTFITPLQVRNGDISNLTNDGVIGRRSTNNLPLYKPEFWERVADLDYNGNLEDPFNSCMPMSVPRMGAPRRIVQLSNEVLLFYAVIFQRNDYRSVPIGERTHPVDRDGSWMGDPIAHWEGDTLVVVTEGFNDQSWIGAQGYIHGYEMKVTEKFRRDGNRLIYDVTVDDPEFFQKPWVRETVTLSKIPDPKYRMEEAPPCSERDNKNLVGKQREM